MPDIRYVCLSDLHFGEEDSLLTNLKEGSSRDIDASKPSPVMKQLVESLKHLISQNEDKNQKPTLVLNGDILELALANTNEATMVFERFVELVMPEGRELFDNRIIYIPGNHDHHIWEIAREVQYADYLKRKVKPGGFHEIPWHTSRMFDPAPSGYEFPDTYLLTKLVQRLEHLKGVSVAAAYPNYGLMSSDRRKCVIFHHGHLMESIYQTMSTLRTLVFPGSKMPETVWDIEAENFAWIDFFWSAMGRSGKVGQTVEQIYEEMHDRELFTKRLSNVAAGLVDIPVLNEQQEGALFNRVLGKPAFAKVVDKIAGLERHQHAPEEPLSESGRKSLAAYVNGPLRQHILTECGRNMPSDVTFVFGHTHKPFQQDMQFAPPPQWTDVYNTGGWIVDTPGPQQLHGGTIILVDEALNVTSVRMYHELQGSAKYPVSVQAATHPGEPKNNFHQRILGIVDPSANPWAAFSATAADEIEKRRRNLEERKNKRAATA